MPAPIVRTSVEEEDLQALVVTDVARHLIGNDLSNLFASVGAVLIALAVFRHAAAPAWIWSWLAVQCANHAFHLAQGLRWRRRELTPASAAQWLRINTRTALVNGLLWTMLVLVVWPGCSDIQRLLILIGLMCILGAALHSLHGHPIAYYAIAVPCVIGVAAASFGQRGLDGWDMPAMLLAYFIASARFAVLLHRRLVEVLRNGHLMNWMAARLEAEKDRAVNLSLSRSRFLAAASHDLRQPVHALSLFVGALKQEPPKEQSRLILQHVGTAVDTMGAMFGTLLDISRLDADLLRPDLRRVDLQPLLARIGAEHAMLASAKGLGLQTSVPPNAAPLIVRTDPVLLERVLRNLLSNAIRYTERGGILVRARARGGRIELVVADSGIGIPKGRREEAFEEFVQLHDPGRDSEQGLGLGLAIVRRLVGLLDLRLVLRSRPGRGSVFVLHLPAVDGPPAAAAAAAEAPGAGTCLQAGDVVLVIDDNAAIQLAMRTVLGGWGCRVYVGSDVDALMPHLMDLQQVPALLLCDASLRGGRDGIATIAQVRETFNRDVPAILITGDTGPERMREAVASGLPLLYKPVTPSHLQDAIALVMAAEGGPAD